MKLKKIIGVILLLGIIYAIVFGSYGVVKILQLKFHIWQLQEEIGVMETRGVLLRYELRLLETNPEYIKRAGREKFGIE